jgi:polyisoprenoid-binding protein YceI
MRVSNVLPSDGSTEAISGSWLLDPQRSSVEFRVGHLWGLVTVKGRFDHYRGQLELGANPAIELTIDAATVRTGNRKRDQHLRSADFFDAANHPQVRFIADTVNQHADNLKVGGLLSAAGRSISLDVDAHVRRVDGELEIDAAATAPHRELGMTYSRSA